MFLLMSSCLSGLRASFSESDSLRAILAAKRPVKTEDIFVLNSSSSANLVIIYIVFNIDK